MIDRTCDEPEQIRPPAHLTPAELAAHWRISQRTLDRWRVAGTGPCWIRLNGRVRYRMVDVLAFEQARLQRPSP